MKYAILSYFLSINLIGFFAMATDKRKAIHNKWRIQEKTLFLIAACFGSFGVLLGMKVFHHKTRHQSFRLGIPLLLIIQLMLCLLFLTWQHNKASGPVHIVENELALIQNLDADTINAIFTYDTLFHPKYASILTSDETAEAVNLFFQNFTYKITKKQLNPESADIEVQIANIDMHALAQDLSRSILKESVAISPDSSAPKTISYSSLLKITLREHCYPLVYTTATFHLIKKNGIWVILPDPKLQDDLVSGFITYIDSPDLLPISEIVSIHLDAFRNLTPEQWSTYLSIKDIFSTCSNSYSSMIDEAYLNKLSKYYDYRILKYTQNNNTATATVRIKSIDMTAILDKYHDSLLKYAASTHAILDNEVEFADATARLLLEAIVNNNSATSTDVEITLHKNESIWEISYDSAFTDALMGNLSQAIKTFHQAPDSNILLIEPRYKKE